MRTNSELFGSFVEVPEFPADVIMRRIELLKDRLEALLDQSYNTRDNLLVHDVIKAIKWHENINKMGET